MTWFIVDALAAGDQRIASETIEADASDTALHEMAERYPKATSYTATEAVQPTPDTEGAIDLMKVLAADLRRRVAEDAEPPTDHEGVDEGIPMWEYRRYLMAVRDFMRLRAAMGEKPSQTLGGVNGAWAHHLLDRLIENADDAPRCRRETLRLEETIKEATAETGSDS